MNQYVVSVNVYSLEDGNVVLMLPKKAGVCCNYPSNGRDHSIAKLVVPAIGGKRANMY